MYNNPEVDRMECSKIFPVSADFMKCTYSMCIYVYLYKYI